MSLDIFHAMEQILFQIFLWSKLLIVYAIQGKILWTFEGCMFHGMIRRWQNQIGVR
jgi:hypothetical protein